MNEISNTNEAGFRQVIEKHKATVYKLAFSYMKNAADADDAFQEVFLRYFRKQPDFADATHEHAWFIRVTINVCRSALRGAWLRKTVPLDERMPSPAAPENELLDAVLRLPPKLREVMHLYYYEDFSVREAADILGISETAAQTRLHRAREKLGQILREEQVLYGKECL